MKAPPTVWRNLASMQFPATVAAALLVSSVGCNDSRGGFVPVSGRVLIDGEALKFGSVRFLPEGGRQSMGGLD
ncbi:MAG: hypothetical protein KDA61_03360 [Planctomycetales bacterium]|nr:hypothetical protein [Planctomycetales bacterium]